MSVSGPPPGIPQVPIGARKIWRAQIARAKATKAANVPILANPAGILRALMLSGLAASALSTFWIVVGDVETDMDDLVDTIHQWLRSQGDIGFSRGQRPRGEKPGTVAIPIPLKPLRRGEATDTIRQERETDRDKEDRERRKKKGQDYWPWLERRFGKPPKYTNLRSTFQHGIASF